MREALSVMVSQVENFEATYRVGDGARAVELCLNEKVGIVLMDSRI